MSGYLVAVVAVMAVAGPLPAAADCILSGLPQDCNGVEGEFTVINSDTGTLFTGDLTPTVSIDDTVFFGRVPAPVAPRGSTSVQPDTALVPEPETGLLVVLGLAILAARNPRGLRR